MNVVYTQAARDDLAALATYLNARHPFAVPKIADDILIAIDHLTDFPFSGRRQDEADVRKLVSRRYRYRIFYRVDEEVATVTILAILHPARQG